MTKYISMLSFLSMLLHFIRSFMIFMILTIWVSIQSFFSIFDKYSFSSKNINDLSLSIISSRISQSINLSMILMNDTKWIYKYLQIIYLAKDFLLYLSQSQNYLLSHLHSYSWNLQFARIEIQRKTTYGKYVLIYMFVYNMTEITRFFSVFNSHLDYSL